MRLSIVRIVDCILQWLLFPRFLNQQTEQDPHFNHQPVPSLKFDNASPPLVTQKSLAVQSGTVSTRNPTKVLIYQKLQKTGSTYFSSLFQSFGLHKGISVKDVGFSGLFRMTKPETVSWKWIQNQEFIHMPSYPGSALSQSIESNSCLLAHMLPCPIPEIQNWVPCLVFQDSLVYSIRKFGSPGIYMRHFHLFSLGAKSLHPRMLSVVRHPVDMFVSFFNYIREDNRRWGAIIFRK